MFLENFSLFLNLALNALFKEASILFSLPGQLITELDCNLPPCLSPILIVGILNEGASKIPLEEFPIIQNYISLNYNKSLHLKIDKHEFYLFDKTVL